MTDTRHLEEELDKQQQMRATVGDGGTRVPDAAADDGKTTHKPVALPPDPSGRELQTALGRGWLALAELLAEFGAAGVLPISAEADRLIRQWLDAGWTVAGMVELISRRLARPGITNDGGYVLTILRNMPEPPTAPAPTLPPWCGRCVVRGRWVPDDYGLPSAVHCPDCWKDARDETDAPAVPARRHTTAADAVYHLGAAIGSGRRDAAFLGASEGVTRVVAATGTEG